MARKGRITRITKITLSDDEKVFTENPIEGTKSDATRQTKEERRQKP